MTVEMYDAIISPQTTGQPIPSVILSAQAVGAYNHGNSWPTWGPYSRARPDLLRAGRIVSITLTAFARARCLDIESGGAVPSQAPGWFRNYAEHTYGKPILYTYASQVAAVIGYMNRAGISRDKYLIWSAHPSPGRHICGPNAFGPGHGCGYPAADLTQYAQLRDYDISLCADYCFGNPGPLPPPPLPEGIIPMAITAIVNESGNTEVFVESEPAKPGQAGEVFHLWKTADGGWHGIPGKTGFDWESLGTPGQ